MTEHHSAMDIDPRQLVLEKQVRTDAEADRALIDSIRERGVLQPIVVTEDEPDTFTVLAGHRRTLAAIEAGLALVPITVVAGRDEKNRIADQLAENDHRVALSLADRVDAFEQMALIGLSVDQIATMTATPASEIEQLHTVARFEPARHLASEQTLDLVQLAALAEFEDDRELLESLIEVGADNPARFQHSLDAARISQQEKRVLSARIAELEAEGFSVIRSEDRDYQKDKTLNSLGIASEDHVACPGKAIIVEVDHEWIDGTWTVQGTREWEVCREASLHGSRSDAQPAIDDDAKKAARSRVIRLNNEWRAAQQTRFGWVKARLAGKWAGTDQFIVSALTYHRSRLGHYGVAGTVQELLGFTADWKTHEVPSSMSAAKAKTQTLGVILAAGEANLSDDAWRSPLQFPLGGIYLRFLEANGYPLCHAERLAAGYDDPDPEEDAS